ncbi:osm1 [Symbiodinium sp. CCMP2592]|nr:osm1 [Symbiodinium sp. CCMP2592]
MASVEDRIKVRILRGLSSRVVTELDMDRRSFVFDVIMAIKKETGLHWRRQRLLHDQQPLGEAQRLSEVIDGPEAEVALVHIDHQNLEPISDRDKLQVMLMSDGEALAYATEEFKRDRDLVLAAVRQTGKALRHVRGALLADEEIVELAMASHPFALARAAKAARKNPKLAAKALDADPDMIRFLHPELLGNEAFLMPHIEKNGLLLERVLRQTSKIASAAVEQNPLALEFCKAHHITEPMTLTAVAKNGLALRFVPAQFKVRQVVLVAVGQNPRAAKYVGLKALLLDAVRENPHALRFARSEFLADADVVSMAFEKDKTSLRYATKPAVLELISRFPHEDLLQFAKDSLQEDVDILSAVQPLHKAKRDLGDWGSAEATVLGLFTFGVFVNVTPSWGGGDPVFALLPKSEFSADFGSDPEKAIRGGKIKVRKLGLNDRGETAPYASACFPSAVIVVGGGLAGMSAANTVVELGGRTILLDKSSFCGGNSTKATSGINGAGTKTQKGKSIPDTAEWIFIADTLKGGAKKPELAKVLCANSAADVDWLVDKFDLDLSLVARLGGHSQPRTHRGKERFPGMTITYALIQMLEKVAEKTNRARIVTKAEVYKLLVNAGTVVGCEYKKAGKTVKEFGPMVLASGGFGADFGADSLLATYRPDLLHLPTTNGEHCTGDAIKMGEAIGAATIDLEWVQVHPTGLVKPDDPDAKVKFLAAEALRGVGGIVLDANGDRFCNELGRRDYVTGEMWKNKPPFRLCLNKAAADEIIWHAKHYTGRGVMKFYASGEDLAKDMGVPLQRIVDAHQKHFEAAKKQEKDPDGGPFPAYPSGKTWDEPSGKTGSGKKFFHNIIDGSKVPTEPFYVAIITPVIHYCMGGLECTVDAECIDKKSGKVIPGLYVAGEAAGGIHGNNRLGGNSLLDCVVFGRVAGKAACKFTFGAGEKFKPCPEPGELKDLCK